MRKQFIQITQKKSFHLYFRFLKRKLLSHIPKLFFIRIFYTIKDEAADVFLGIFFFPLQGCPRINFLTYGQ